MKKLGKVDQTHVGIGAIVGLFGASSGLDIEAVMKALQGMTFQELLPYVAVLLIGKYFSSTPKEKKRIAELESQLRASVPPAAP